jgi:hypothetical protein
MSRLVSELEKTDLMCDECHRHRTLKRRGQVHIRLTDEAIAFVLLYAARKARTIKLGMA